MEELKLPCYNVNKVCIYLIFVWSFGGLMPLVKSASKEALAKNIKTEEKSKPRKQAIAIGLAEQRKMATGKRKAKLEEAYGRFLGKREEE